jgi:hypothetical protein
MLMDNVPTKQQMKIQYNILIPNSLYQKVMIIKQLEQLLNIKTLQLDTKIYIDRFDEVVKIDNKLKNTIIRIFKYTESDNLTFRFWYYRLIKMYKNILDNDIVVCSKIMQNYNRCYSYTINEEKFNIYQNLT